MRSVTHLPAIRRGRRLVSMPADLLRHTTDKVRCGVLIRRCSSANDWMMMNYIVVDHATDRRLGSGTICVHRVLEVTSNEGG